MAIIEPTGLKGMRGVGELSKPEYDAFIEANKDKIAQHGYDPVYINKLYSNKQFIDKYGIDTFKSLPSFEARNRKYKEDTVNEAFDAAYKPQVVNGKIDNMTGAGEDWDQIQDLSIDAKEQLLKSEWKTPAQRKKEQESRDAWYEKAIDFVAGEAIQQHKKESNQKILDRIYNDDADSAASQQGTTISQVYNTMPEVTGVDDEDTKQKFKEAVTPSKTNLGIPEYASHLDSSEMEDFSIDEMRQVLAKKYVYDRTMSPRKAQTALNNEAKRYITAHQGSLKRFGLFAKDVGISAMSYTADKINGIYNLALAVEDWAGDKPTVFVDDQSNILDPNKVKVVQDKNGNLFYQGEDGKNHSVHREQVDRRTLHNLGKNEDGSEAEEGIFHLNPQYWTKAEQFGTLDADEQKQWEKIGSSPYKVSYNPNDESDLVYESFKMMSFGIADAASMLIPFGVGIGGRVLSTASNIGRVGRGMGKALETTGKYLSVQSRVGQVAQGLAGAGGIAYAYERGAFNETLQQNLANAEEANLNLSKREVYDRYNNDKQYKAQVDAMVANRAAQMKREYLANPKPEGQPEFVTEQALNEEMLRRANIEVHNELVAQKVQENKGTDAYAALQQEAIQSAGDAAWTTFWPEAIKYGLVNTLGYRKFLYTNPQGVAKKVSQSLKGLGEVTTKEGRQRLVVGATEFGSVGAKAKKLGKIAGSQFWGGAWTNGTDDMMVDAAERINQDSFDRYLKAYENGEALADEYGLIDGIYSYWKGLNNSLGQGTTYNAAAVGGFGSLVSASPNMANIAHLATKEGRDAYKSNFEKRFVYETDENGYKTIKKDADGKPMMEDIPLSENWRERLGFFVQNGVLNNYYGAKQNERDLQNHADYINGILDRYDDFSALKGLITSNIERQNAETLGDEKTMRFVHAFEAINALEQLANSKDESAMLSSSIDEAKAIIEGASKLGTDESTLSEQQVSQLLSEYYAHNPGVAESDVNHEIALSHIAQNAQKMQEAYKAFNEAEEHISNYEKTNNISIVPAVRFKMKLAQALDGHWKERVQIMKDEIGDTSTTTSESEGETLIATVGGKKKAESFIKVYDLQEKKLLNDVSEAVVDVQKKLDTYNTAQKAVRDAETSEARYQAEQAAQTARTEYEEAVEERSFREDILESTRDKKQKLQEALDAWEKGDKSKVLTADEIMNLDPVSRAKMMDPKSRPIFNKKQQKEIEKLESRLKMQDSTGDPLQKIQDIATLTQRIAQNEDAYNRLSRNPDAAALQMEKQTIVEAEKAYNLINQRNAQILANTVQDMVNGLKVHKDVKKKDIDDVAYRMLRKHNPTLLDIIDREGLLLDHQQQIADAKAWSKVLSDIDAVISQSNQTPEEKVEIGKAIDTIVEPASNKDEIISRLEQAIDSNHPQAEVFDKLLSDMTNLGYQRNSTVLEKRKERKEREEAAKVKADEEAKKKENESRKAAEDAARVSQDDTRSTDEDFTEEEKRKALEEAEGPSIDFGEGKPEAKKETTAEDNLPSEIVVKGTSKTGKEREGKYTVNKDADGFVHLKHKGTGITMRRISPSDVQEIGLGVDDIIGKNEDYNTPENYDALKKIFEEEGFSIENMTIRPDGTVAVKTNEDYFELTGEKAQKFLNKFFPELKEGVEQNKSAETSVIDNVKQGHDDTIGDYVEGHSPTVTEEMRQAKDLTDDVVVSNDTTDSDTVNDSVEKANETEPTTLSGNAMAEYDATALREHRLEHKKGEKPNDPMNQYYDWMKNAGVKLQNIIDDELPKILAANSHVKIKFMRVRPTPNATHDEALKNTMLLVVDYDNSINKGITSIHNEDNGGVVDSAGKKYLIIGTLGYGDSGLQSERGKLWQSLNTAKVGHSLPTVAWQWFKQPGHEAERFYVHEGFYTEQVPGSMIPGWIIRENETDEYPQSRRISELLADKNRNPHGLNFNNLAWSIIEYTQSVDINTKGREVMHPRNQDANAGRVFVLIPAGNGKLLAAKIDALYLNDEKFNKESALYQELQQLFTQLAAPQYKDRYDALVQLFQKLYMTEDGHNILLDPNANAITFKRAGNKINTVYTKAPNFNIQELFDAIAEWNPRINITAKVLSSPKELQKYDEAGALMTDLAKLGTAGINYNVYAIDSEGNMIKPAEVEPKVNRAASDSEYRDSNRQDVHYLYGELYHYDVDADTYTKNGVAVTDAETIKGLDYARRIVGQSPAKTEGVWDYYVLSEGEKAEVIKQSNKTKKIEDVQGEEAQKLIQEIEEQKAAAAREAAIQAKLEEGKDTSSTVVDEETGEITVVEQEEKKEEHKLAIPIKPASTQEGAQNFSQAVRSKTSRTKIMDAIKDKVSKDSTWSDAPIKSPKQLEEYLRKKGVQLDMIPTDDAGLGAWIHNNIECK